jgi:hypothetical protein
MAERACKHHARGVRFADGNGAAARESAIEPSCEVFPFPRRDHGNERASPVPIERAYGHQDVRDVFRQDRP